MPVILPSEAWITSSGYESTRGLVFWETTKNVRPHSVPLAHQAVVILDDLCANAVGLFFPSATDPARPAVASSLIRVIGRFSRLTRESLRSSRATCAARSRR
jgi:integrase